MLLTLSRAQRNFCGHPHYVKNFENGKFCTGMINAYYVRYLLEMAMCGGRREFDEQILVRSYRRC